MLFQIEYSDFSVNNKTVKMNQDIIIDHKASYCYCVIAVVINASYDYNHVNIFYSMLKPVLIHNP